jgi:hypothetical protein
MTACRHCTEPATRGMLCEKHAEATKAAGERCRKKKIEAGLCLRCTEPATRWKMCEKHAEEAKQSRDRHNEKRRLAGTCRMCPRPATSGTMCEEHAERRNEKLRNARRIRIETGLCRYCPQPATRGKMCEKHAEANNQAHDRRIKKLFDSGLCVGCGKRLVEGGHYRCAGCRSRKHRQQITWRRSRCCATCGANLLELRTSLRQAPPNVRDAIWHQLSLRRKEMNQHNQYPWAIAFLDHGEMHCAYCLGGKPGLQGLVERKLWPMILWAGSSQPKPATWMADRDVDSNPWSAKVELAAEAISDWEHKNHVAWTCADGQGELVRFAEPKLGIPLSFDGGRMDVPEDASDYSDLDEQLRCCR